MDTGLLMCGEAEVWTGVGGEESLPAYYGRWVCSYWDRTEK